MAEAQFQPDSPQILEDGTGTPYLAIFDGTGSPIKDPLSGLPIGMLTTDFQYEYIEDGPDSGYFVIECDNPDIISLSSFRYQMPLKLQWGYIYPSKDPVCGPVRTVIVVGHSFECTPEGTKVTIEFSDSSILLNNTPSKYYPQVNDFVGYLTDLLNGSPVGVQIVDYNNQVVIEHKKVAQRVIPSGEVQKMK